MSDMLRRKLLLVLGSLIALLLVAGVCAVLLVQNVLNDLIRVTSVALTETNEISQLETILATAESTLNELRVQGESDPKELLATIASLEERFSSVSNSPVVSEEAAPIHDRMRALLPTMIRHLGDLAATQDPGQTTVLADSALQVSETLRAEIAQLSRITHSRRTQEQQELIKKFRWTGLAVAAVFLLLLNASIGVLLRTASMILKPVDTLVEASRRLAREEFDHRVEVDRRDEFGELARAYNGLAERLQSNEQRKIETLRQVARTLNHELNNAISTIELQLLVIARRSGGDQSMAEPLRQMRETLGRISNTVEALKHVRRIALTDYLSGVKMLDLKRSVEEDPLVGDHDANTTAEMKPS